METREFEIRTERLLLRPHRLEDVDDIFEFARDPQWGRYLTTPMPYLREHAVEFVEDRIVGGIGIEIDVEYATGALGYSIAKEHWGRGLTVEAARAVIDWAFRERGLAKVYAYADARNTPSLRVMEELGMTREGRLRSHRKLRNERVDDVYYGLLREEWERDDS